MKNEILEPIEREVGVYSEADYDDMLDEEHGEFMGYSASRILAEIDPIAYRRGFNNFQEYKTVYECPICGEEFDDEDEARECCQSEAIAENEEEDEEV